MFGAEKQPKTVKELAARKAVASVAWGQGHKPTVTAAAPVPLSYSCCHQEILRDFGVQDEASSER